MTNAEKYKDEIWDITMQGYPFAIKENNGKLVLCDGFISCVDCAFNGGKTSCRIYRKEWLNSEYKEPEIDWSKVTVDTPILVRNYETQNWVKRYFTKYENGKVFAWSLGSTSWSSDGAKDTVSWKYAKLAEDGDLKHE